MKRYALKAVNDEETTCMICGKVELKRVMWICEIDQDGNQVAAAFPCGTTCGSRLVGIELKDIIKFANDFDRRKQVAIYNLMRQRCDELGLKQVIAVIEQTCKRFTEKQNHPLWQERTNIIREASQWANEQDITIEF